MAELVNRAARWRVSDSQVPARVFAVGFWMWSGFLAFLGLLAGLNCEGGNGCISGFPSWFRPWTWGDHYVYPEVMFVGFVGFLAASAFVAAVIARRRWLGAIALLVSLVLLTYPYCAGLTPEGRAIFWFGPFFAFVALLGVRQKKN